MNSPTVTVLNGAVYVTVWLSASTSRPRDLIKTKKKCEKTLKVPVDLKTSLNCCWKG